MDGLEKLRIKYLDLINKDNDQNSLENLRVEILGKKGELSLKMRELGSMTPERTSIYWPSP